MRNKEVIIVKQSPWRTGKGVDPHCIVILKIIKGGAERIVEYTTHEMVMRPGKTEPEWYLGHYFTTLTAAENDFKKRGK